MHPHVPGVGLFADHADLVRRVQRAQLGALRDGDDLRHGPVFVGPAPGLSVDQLRSELAVGRGHGEQLEPAHPLGRAALVDVDVRALGAHHGTPAIGDRLQCNHIRTRAVEDRECLGGRAEVFADDALQVLGVCVVTVGDLVPAVGQRQGGKHLRVNTRVVVTGKAANVRVVTTPGIGIGHVHGFWRSVSRLGCTRFGSPGIFGVPSCCWPCSPALMQLTILCHARSCRAGTRLIAKNSLSLVVRNTAGGST